MMNTPDNTAGAYWVPVMIPAQTVADLIVTAFEGGSNYWVGSASLAEGNDEPGIEGPWYSKAELFANPFEISILDAESENRWVLTRAMVEDGLKWLAKNRPETFDQIITENHDAETADIFLQIALFEGEIVFG